MNIHFIRGLLQIVYIRNQYIKKYIEESDVVCLLPNETFIRIAKDIQFIGDFYVVGEERI